MRTQKLILKPTIGNYIHQLKNIQLMNFLFTFYASLVNHSHEQPLHETTHEEKVTYELEKLEMEKQHIIHLASYL